MFYIKLYQIVVVSGTLYVLYLDHCFYYISFLINIYYVFIVLKD